MPVETRQLSRHSIQLQHKLLLTSGTLFPAESKLAFTLQLVHSVLPCLPSSPSAASSNVVPAAENTQPTSPDSKPIEPKPKPTKWRTRIQTHSQTTHLRHPSFHALTAQSATPRAELLVSVAPLPTTTPPIPHRQYHYHQHTEWAASRALAPADSTVPATPAFPPAAAQAAPRTATSKGATAITAQETALPSPVAAATTTPALVASKGPRLSMAPVTTVATQTSTARELTLETKALGGTRTMPITATTHTKAIQTTGTWDRKTGFKLKLLSLYLSAMS
jgi:hypothetical protein